jgi:hypothetical protein
MTFPPAAAASTEANHAIAASSDANKNSFGLNRCRDCLDCVSYAPILTQWESERRFETFGCPPHQTNGPAWTGSRIFQRDERPTTTTQFTGNAKLSFTLPIRISHGNLKPSTHPWLRIAFYFRLWICLHFQWDARPQSGHSRGARSPFVLNEVNIGQARASGRRGHESNGLPNSGC